MIEAWRLTKRYGEFRALEDLSFRVEAGETFAFLGPNGSGKTTTLKCICGLTMPTAGEVLLNGLNGRTNSREARRLLSYLPQRVAFHENLTAGEVLEFYRRLRKLPAGRIDQVMEKLRFNWPALAGKLVSELSGGMVQRLGIAVAVLPESPILVLDEPTVSLDPEGAVRFREFILSLKAEGRTIVFSSHVLSDVELLADRVAILVDGKLAALESVELLKDELRTNSLEEIYLRHVNESNSSFHSAADGGMRNYRAASG